MKLIVCPVCGIEKKVGNGGKFCSRECGWKGRGTTKGRLAWNSGKKMPHTPEWEANRLAKIRESAKNKVYPRGYTRPLEHTAPMKKALKIWQEKNPDLIRANALANLPKNVARENNPNWRGGKTEEKRDFATTNSTKIRKWRNAVLDRDDRKCKSCGATSELEVHHILPLVITKEMAFDRANGVTLCKECHKKTDSHGAKGRRFKPITGGIHITFIPSSWQDYDTLGNWRRGKDGTLSILISDDAPGIPTSEHKLLVAIHELVEAILCQKRGITQEVVDKFDMETFKGNGEPGDSQNSPYRREHRQAMLIEHLMADFLGITGYGVVK